VVVVEEIVLPDRPHVGEQALARPDAELPQGRPLPLGRRLDDLGVDRMQAAVVVDVERDGRARSVPVEVVVHTARGVDDQGNLDRLEAELAAQAVLDHALRRVERPHGLARAEQRLVVVGQDVLELAVVADPRSRQVGLFHAGHRSSSVVPSILVPRDAQAIRSGAERSCGGVLNSAR
jgi:hypothetical protein